MEKTSTFSLIPEKVDTVITSDCGIVCEVVSTIAVQVAETGMGGCQTSQAKIQAVCRGPRTVFQQGQPVPERAASLVQCCHGLMQTR